MVGSTRISVAEFASRFSFIEPTKKRPAAIAAAVVEAVMRRIVGSVGYFAAERAVRVGEPHSAAQRDHEAARPDAARSSQSIRASASPRCDRRRIEAVERRRVDVDPVQRLFLHRPHRTLAEAGLDVEDAE
jgi:hypothetical protein